MTQADHVSPADQQVTAIISHCVRQGRQRGYEQWLQGITAAARQFAGHSGITILRPQPGAPPEYVIILRFETYQHLQHWMNSDIRKRWIERAEPLTDKVANVQVLTGLDYLASLPGQSPPPRYKTALLIWMGVFCCSSILGIVLMPHLMIFPFLVRQAIVVAITVGLLTYGVMPVLTRLFARWLHTN